jgi:hypothetical protein
MEKIYNFIGTEKNEEKCISMNNVAYQSKRLVGDIKREDRR